MYIYVVGDGNVFPQFLFFLFFWREALPIPLISWFLHMEPFFLVFLQDPSITLKCIDKRSHGTELMTFYVLMPPAAFQAQVQFSGCSSSAYPRELEHVWDTGNGFRLEKDSLRWDLLSTFQFLAAASMLTPVGSGHGFPLPEGISPWAGSDAPPQTEHHTSEGSTLILRQEGAGWRGRESSQTALLARGAWNPPNRAVCLPLWWLIGFIPGHASNSSGSCSAQMPSSRALWKLPRVFASEFLNNSCSLPSELEWGWEWAPWKAEETPEVSQQKELCNSHSCGHFGHINEVLRLSITCQSTQGTL